MSSLFSCYGIDDVNKTYPKIKFNVIYVVSICGFSLHALQAKLWSIKHEGVRPQKMGASLLKSVFHDEKKVSSVHSWTLSLSSHSFFHFFLKLKNKNILKRKSRKNLKTWENNIKTRMASIVRCVYFILTLFEHKPFFLKLKLAVLYRDEYLRFF